MPKTVDYALYLVTDSTEAILGSRDLVDVVEQALQGGVTIVQYRDKTSDTAVLISTARKLHERCRAHNIPLLINDRVDVALAVGCEGVHVGQDDMSVADARRLLGPDKIIGATVSSLEEAKIAVEQDADYLGIGTLYPTSTKKNTKDIIGIRGIRTILRNLDSADEASRSISTVCIGGINASNVQLVKHQLFAPSRTSLDPKTIDGVAVVSTIIGAQDPKSAAADLAHLLQTPPPFASTISPLPTDTDPLASLLIACSAATASVHTMHPLSHNMTNLVVQNFAANVALSVGASPIMANYGAEAADLAKLRGALVINMGTVTPDGLANYGMAVRAYNAVGGPIVLDPVGAGATGVRRNALARILEMGYFALVKGNEAEILAFARAVGLSPSSSGAQQQQRGVDSGMAHFSTAQRGAIVCALARQERNIVLMTGATDVISDGRRTLAISNGDPILGRVTGTGCTLGTTLSAYLAAYKEDALVAALAGILHFEVAAEDAARGAEGPGSFVPRFLDELAKLGRRITEGEVLWGKRAKVEILRDVGAVEREIFGET